MLNSYDKTKILDSLFRHVCFQFDAYTRSTKGMQASAGGYLSYVAGNQVRGDVAEPTETRNKHAEFLQGAFRQMLKGIKESGVPLSRDEISVLSKSPLTKYIPGQYQHEVAKQAAPLLALETQSIFELEYNFDSWKRYIEEEFSVKFS
ncbi:hypothetical protein [Endozoicomonas sp.]|uniref:hypothetical protein n=1 Tax=Endozoicomonas sp. TaxID=1892382 RepID=UPI003AF563DB